MSVDWKAVLEVLSAEERKTLLCEEAYLRAVELGFVTNRGEYIAAVRGWPDNPFSPSASQETT